MPRGPLVLTILDGWGFSNTIDGNAIAAASKPNYDYLVTQYPNILVHTSGPCVGLPEGQMGSRTGALPAERCRGLQWDLLLILRSQWV